MAGLRIGRQNRPHLLVAVGQRVDVEVESHITLFRYTDVPGMIGRVGTCFGTYGVKIVSAAVGRQPETGETGSNRLAAMAITTDTLVPPEVIAEIVASEGFVAGRTVRL